MERLTRYLIRFDGWLAWLESFLLCILFFSLAAGGIALVLLQNVPASDQRYLFLACRGLAVLFGGLGLGMMVAGVGRRKGHPTPQSGGRVLLLAVLTVLVWFALHVPAAIEQLQRAIVLWVGMLAAGLATRQRKHITIEALEKFIKPGVKRYATCLVSIVAVVLLVLLVQAAWGYVGDSRDKGRSYLELYDYDFVLPEWWVKVILPVGLIIMMWRFALIPLDEFFGPKKDASPLDSLPVVGIDNVHDEASWADESSS